MKIAFDAVPLIGEKMTGVGWCEAGQTTAMAKLHPEEKYTFNLFSRKDDEIKLERLKPFRAGKIGVNIAHFSGFAYRAASTLLPVPYSRFFGKSADLTHFFNFIVPPGVHGKTVVTVHDMAYKAFPETVRGRTKYMLDIGLKKSMERADRIVTVSEFSKSEIIKYYPQFEDKLRVVHCGVDLNRFAPCTDNDLIEKAKQNHGIEGDYFLYLGTIEPRKNLERLIEAYSIFLRHRKGKAPKLILAGGKGWLCEGIYNKAKELKLGRRVVFTEYISSEEICPLMCGAEAFVFPSLYEGFGMPPLEAMACGVPVLTSDAASLPEVVGDCAVVCRYDSAEDIAEGFEKIHSSSQLRQELSQKGMERAKTFSWESSAEKLFAVYKELCDE